jgi:RNA polymerase primary sigma factor
MSDSIKNYLNSIAKYPLLTPQQEIQLGRRVQRLRELQSLDRPLTNAEQRERRSGERARQRFIQCNLQLVVHVARRYDKRNNKTMELLDLIQEGNIGLSRAVELFDPSRGYKFSTYAYWWIRQGITRALISSDAIIRLPIGVHETMYKINRTIQALSHQLGYQPTITRVAEEIDMDPGELSNLLRQTYTVTSIDQQINNSEGHSIVDTIADPNVVDNDISQDVQIMLRYVDQYLDDRTKAVIEARSCYPAVTWTQLEREYGISKTALYDIYKRGVGRIRMLMSNPLTDTPLGTNDQASR